MSVTIEVSELVSETVKATGGKYGGSFDRRTFDSPLVSGALESMEFMECDTGLDNAPGMR